MKVKVTPRDGAGNPIPGAGSFEAKVNYIDGEHYITAEGDHFHKTHCELIPSVTPEPGDIVEGEDGLPFFYDPVKTVECCARSRPRQGAGTKEAGDDGPEAKTY